MIESVVGPETIYRFTDAECPMLVLQFSRMLCVWCSK